MAHQYFTAVPLDSSTESVEIVGDEARHAAKVARLREGEHIVVSDGRGWSAEGIAQSVSPSLIRVEVSTPVFEPPRTPEFVLVQALAKGDRDEMAVQSCTELGVSRIVPWQAERSVSRWEGDKQAKGVARWAAIATEASKQALRSRIPEVTQAVTTAGLMSASQTRSVLVLDPRAELSIVDWALANPEPESVAIVVGPEGGISETELKSLMAAGAVAVSVGSDILRTSTAGTAAIAALSALLGLW